MGLVKSAVADAVLTAMWIFTMPFLRLLTAAISASLGVQTLPIALFAVSTLVVSLMMFVFTVIGTVLGDASFNPTVSVVSYAAGLKKDASLFSMAVRFPAQAAGGVIGVKAILKFLPKEIKETLKGPSLKVDYQTGFFCESLLTFGLCFALLLILIKGPNNPAIKLVLMAATTVGCVGSGAKYTGPSLNPANAFGWAYVNNWHNSWEFFIVYWLGPLIGATLAARVFRFLMGSSSSSTKKEKKA